AIHRAMSGPGREHQAALSQIVKHAAHELLVVAVKSREHLRPCGNLLAFQIRVNGLPQGSTVVRRALREPLDLSLVGAERQPEHVGAYLATDALLIELPNELQKHLIGHMGQWRAGSPGRRQLRNENRRLANDGIDENLDVHEASLPNQGNER